MHTDQEVVAATLARFELAWRQQSINQLLALMTDDCVYEASVGPEPGRTYAGKWQVRLGLVAIFAHDEGALVTLSPPIIVGSKAAWEWKYEWERRKGRRAVRGCDFFDFKGALIRRKSGYRKCVAD